MARPKFSPANFNHVFGAVRTHWTTPAKLRSMFPHMTSPDWKIYANSHLSGLRQTAAQMERERQTLPKRLPGGVRKAINSASTNRGLREVARAIADYHKEPDVRRRMQNRKA